LFANIEQTMPDERTCSNINKSKASAEARLAKLSVSQTEGAGTGSGKRTSESFASKTGICFTKNTQMPPVNCNPFEPTLG